MRLALLVIGLGMVIGLALRGDANARADVGGLSIAEFRDQVIAEIRHQFPAAKVISVDEHELKIELPGEPESTQYLDRAYVIYQANPEVLPTMLRNIAAGLGPHPPPTAASLLVLVRPTSFVAAMPGAEGGPPLSRPLVGDLVAVVAVDRPDSFALMPRAELRDDLKLTDDAIWARALQNTRRCLNARPIVISRGQPIEIDTEEGLAPSLLLLDDVWNAPSVTAHGPPVAAVFARGIIFVASLGDARSVARLRKLMNADPGDPNGLTTDLFVRRNGRWEILR